MLSSDTCYRNWEVPSSLLNLSFFFYKLRIKTLYTSQDGVRFNSDEDDDDGENSGDRRHCSLSTHFVSGAVQSDSAQGSQRLLHEANRSNSRLGAFLKRLSAMTSSKVGRQSPSQAWCPLQASRMSSRAPLPMLGLEAEGGTR